MCTARGEKRKIWILFSYIYIYINIYIYLRLLSASKFKLYPSPHFVHLLARCALFFPLFFFLFRFFQCNRSNAQPSVHHPPTHYPRSSTSDGRDWKLPSTRAMYSQSGTKSILHFLPRRRFENHGIKVNRLQQSSALSEDSHAGIRFSLTPLPHYWYFLINNLVSCNVS